MDGVTGTYFQEGFGDNERYTVVWVKGDVVYGLTGDGDFEEANRIVKSLQ